MRHISVIALTALLVASSSAAQTQQLQLTGQPPAGSIEFGLRVTDVSGDDARFQRFRDIGDGAVLDRVRFNREGPGWFVTSGAEHIGRTDQRYWLEYGGRSKVKVRFQWDQIPMSLSGDTRTLYSTAAPGVLRLPGGVAQNIQSGQLPLGDAAAGARVFDLRSRRDTALFNLVYSPTRHVDVKVNVRTARREGTMPWGAAFGFSNVVELPAPLDTRTTDFDAGVEWVNARGMLRVGYDGSWFDNHVETLVWDNPWKATDLPAGTIGSQGRLALWPGSSTQSLNTAGSLKLPANSRLNANVSVGRWSQNAPLLPFTINTTVPAAPLPRPTADARVNTLAMNYNVTSRPTRRLWLNARYRYYDFDNRMPEFDASGFVLLDQRAAAGHESHPLSSTRQTFEADASFTPAPFTALRVGYGREAVDRTARIFETTADNVLRASVDSTFKGWITLRAIAERSARTGSGLDEEELEEMGEKPELRHYDIADRDRNRITGLVQLTPWSTLGVSFAAASGKDDYRNSGFGLRSNDNRTYTLTADYTPRDEIAVGVSYTDEKYTAFQNSRSGSGAQALDPTRDWSIDSADKARTFISNLDVIKLVPKTEIRTAYSVSRSTAAYVYGVPATSTLPALVQLPTVLSELHTGTADVRYLLTQKIAIGVLYWYDRYRVNDFALGEATINRLDLPGTLFLGYVYRPYTANSGSVRLIYVW